MAIADRVIAVVAEKETKITRVMQRSQLSREETIAIMDSQTSDKQRLEFADDVIHNDGTIQDAQQAAEKLHERYLSTTKLLK